MTRASAQDPAATAVAGEQLVALFEAAGTRFFTGVPCSLLKGFISSLETRQAAQADGEPPIYVASVREDEAVGLATGSAMAGDPACVLMQNSGLGNCLNALASLNAIYEVPLVLVISWRGHLGNDAPEHIVMGASMERLLTAFSVPFQTLEPEAAGDQVAWAHREAKSTGRPVALIVRKGVVA